jgi:hypothetical protein
MRRGRRSGGYAEGGEWGLGGGEGGEGVMRRGARGGYGTDTYRTDMYTADMYTTEMYTADIPARQDQCVYTLEMALLGRHIQRGRSVPERPD